MIKSKNPAHSDFKTVLDFIPILNKVKDLEERILGQQNHAFIYFDKITRILIDNYKFFLTFLSLTN